MDSRVVISLIYHQDVTGTLPISLYYDQPVRLAVTPPAYKTVRPCSFFRSTEVVIISFKLQDNQENLP